jgi:hypothetical protein
MEGKLSEYQAEKMIEECFGHVGAVECIDKVWVDGKPFPLPKHSEEISREDFWRRAGFHGEPPERIK